MKSKMNIFELLKNEKVEWKKLGEVCEIRAGSTFPKHEQGREIGKYPFYKVADMNKTMIYMDLADNYIDDDVAKKLKCNPAPKGSIIFPKVGATLSTNKKRILTTDSCFDNNIFALIPNQINAKYLYYVFSRMELLDFANGQSAVPSINKETMTNIMIPVPSIEVQKKIVKTLDKFTEYVTELQAELQAELQYRTLQYNYYRDKLLSEEYLDKMSNEIREFEVKWEKLEDLLYYEQPTKFIVSSTEYDKSYKTPVLTAGQKFILGYTNENEGICCADKNDPVIIFDDFTTDNKWVDFSFKVKSSAMKILRPKVNTNLRYCYYYMSTIKSDISEHKRMWISEYSKIEIPIPPLTVQNKVVNILDKFQDILKETEGLLPTEIEQRQKQYEYYREKLLTFGIESGTASQPASQP